MDLKARVRQVFSHLNHPKGFFPDQVAIVTGSGQGIGAEVARLFANEGAKVVVCDIDDAKAKSVAESINAASGKAIAVSGDITDQKVVDNLIKQAAEFGNGKIHIIVNNAGFTWDAVVHKTTLKQWEAMLAIHCTAPFNIIKAAAPYFRVTDGEPRCIVNISSQSGVHGNAGQSNYAVAKAGITGLTRSIAKEWGPKFGVRANTIAFGAVQTRLTQGTEIGAAITMSDGSKVTLGIPGATEKTKSGNRYTNIPLRRAATPTEAASAVLAAASPLFSYVTGQTIEVDGGLYM
ncbi:hypothetical protein GQ44DRAFT_743806 [Phaeosphaeriaceae sp. PMI808]|nr:hypothetical protein GQ44DRAFT_743806 [Phaeosphaeriaceae sp. PMI808]